MALGLDVCCEMISEGARTGGVGGNFPHTLLVMFVTPMIVH